MKTFHFGEIKGSSSRLEQCMRFFQEIKEYLFCLSLMLWISLNHKAACVLTPLDLPISLYALSARLVWPAEINRRPFPAHINFGKLNIICADLNVACDLKFSIIVRACTLNPILVESKVLY